jgi:hypothetical protein
MRKYYCDICGKELLREPKTVLVPVDIDHPYEDVIYIGERELCNECLAELYYYLDKQEKKHGK